MFLMFFHVFHAPQTAVKSFIQYLAMATMAIQEKFSAADRKQQLEKFNSYEIGKHKIWVLHHTQYATEHDLPKNSDNHQR